MPPPAPPDDVDRPQLTLADVGRAQADPGSSCSRASTRSSTRSRFGADLLGVWTADPKRWRSCARGWRPTSASARGRRRRRAGGRRPAGAGRRGGAPPGAGGPRHGARRPAARPRSSCSRTRATSATSAPASASRRPAGAAGVLTTGALGPVAPRRPPRRRRPALRPARARARAPSARATGRSSRSTPPAFRWARRAAGRAVLAFGTERDGLSAEVLSRADARVALPMAPGVSSLNLATAVAAVLFGAARRSDPAGP